MSDAREARRALGTLVAGDDAQLDLPLAALLVASEEYPSLDLARYVARLDGLGAALRDRLAGETAPERQVAVLNALLFGEEGFRGNEGAYYDPRNSYLNEVLDRRLGIPLTLSVIYVAIGQRAGLPLSGVGLPGHFLVGFEGPTRLLIDAFACGRVVGPEECQALLRRIYGGSVALTAEHLAATPPRQILARLITNLKVAYQRSGDLARALRASEQLSLVLPSAAELRERGQLRYRLADFAGAQADLTRYLELAPEDAEAIRKQLELIRELYERRN